MTKGLYYHDPADDDQFVHALVKPYKGVAFVRTNDGGIFLDRDAVVKLTRTLQDAVWAFDQREDERKREEARKAKEEADRKAAEAAKLKVGEIVRLKAADAKRRVVLSDEVNERVDVLYLETGKVHVHQSARMYRRETEAETLGVVA